MNGNLAEFREATRAWLRQNLPESLAGGGEGYAGGTRRPARHPDTMRWLEACYERGWTVPTWFFIPFPVNTFARQAPGTRGPVL